MERRSSGVRETGLKLPGKWPESRGERKKKQQFGNSETLGNTASCVLFMAFPAFGSHRP